MPFVRSGTLRSATAALSLVIHHCDLAAAAALEAAAEAAAAAADADATESDVSRPSSAAGLAIDAEPAAPAPAPASAFNPDKVFKVDESPLMAYISRSWNKLDGSDTVEVEEMLKDPATVATINQPDELGANLCGNQPECRVPREMTRPSWIGRATRNEHRHAIEQASRRWCGGRRDDSARTRRKILISTQARTP